MTIDGARLTISPAEKSCGVSATAAVPFNRLGIGINRYVAGWSLLKIGGK